MTDRNDAAKRGFTGFAVWQLYFFSAAACIIGIVGAFSFCDPHFLNRMGALTVAAGAIMIVVQFRYDLEVERTKADILAQTASRAAQIQTDAAASPVIKSIAERMLREESASTVDGAEDLRSRAVVHVAAFTAFGVLVDGFGDYLAKGLLSAAGLHCH